MKKLLSLLVLASLAAASAQSFTRSTNLWFTNTISGTNTQTYTGTNCLDLTRYRTFALVATGQGTNLSTNTISWTFKASVDNTNYDLSPTFTLSGTANGTNRFHFFTNLSAGDGVGYLRPFQIISSVTNDVTNAWTFGVVKTYPRN